MRTITIMFSPRLAEELYCFEVDTLDDVDGPGKHAFAAAMEQGRQLARGLRVTLDKAAYDYMMSYPSGALSNVDDI